MTTKPYTLEDFEEELKALLRKAQREGNVPVHEFVAVARHVLNTDWGTDPTP